MVFPPCRRAVTVENDEIKAKIAFLNTPKGNALKSLIDIPGLEFRPSIHGSTTTLEDGTVMVDEIYDIQSIDACFFGVGKE